VSELTISKSLGSHTINVTIHLVVLHAFWNLRGAK
jgi:hypothetical protein